MHQAGRQCGTLAVLLGEFRHGQRIERRLVLLRGTAHVRGILAVVAVARLARAGQAGVNFPADETTYDDVSHGGSHITEILEEAEESVRLINSDLVAAAAAGGRVVRCGPQRWDALLAQVLQQPQDHFRQHILGYTHQLVGRAGSVSTRVLSVLKD